MASSGLFGRPNSGSKGFDFASDDILCSYEDYGAQDRSNGNFSDPTIVVSPSKVYSVINYVLPVKHEYPSEPDYVVYLHRIGRAGHFGYRWMHFVDDAKPLLRTMEMVRIGMA